MAIVLVALAPVAICAQDVDWPHYHADAGATSYSALSHIDRDNVAELEVAWEFNTGDPGYAIQCTPVILDGVLYGISATHRIFALDAARGAQLWSFDGLNGRTPRGASRGMAVWRSGDHTRLLVPVMDRLYALDAETGQPVLDFGDGGHISLRDGLDRPLTDDQYVFASSPGVVYEDLLVMGSWVGEGPGPAAPGHIRAFDVRTGERAWIFHTIPHPGEYGYETWPPDAWKRVGGVNSWAGMSLDEERGIVYIPTGSASYDHYGGDRHGANLFANSVVALDARTGKRIWHFQTVHHDIWDYDVAAPPVLATITSSEGARDVVAQPTKTGFVFVLDRDTGEPVFPVVERPVPQSNIEGEETWPTQPFPTAPPPHAAQGFTAEDVTDRTEEAAEYVRGLLEAFGESELYSPPDQGGTFVYPQFNGGTDWGGGAFDPQRNWLFVNASNEPEMTMMVPADPETNHGYPWLDTGRQPVVDPDGFPISKRPWGTLSAVDIQEGTIAWQVPLGTYPELEEQGLPPTGTFNMGGPIATAGGVVFIGASMDERFRAYDSDTGEVLWTYQLPAGGYATPATYMVDGEQYVVIAAGGGGKPGTKRGDAYVAFKLP